MSHKILIVEDNGIIAMQLCADFKSLGFIVAHMTSNIESAKKFLQQSQVDIACLDVNLGEGQGVFPLADELSKRGIPFFFMTGYNFSEIVPERYSKAAHIEKPYTVSDIKEVLKREFSDFSL